MTYDALVKFFGIANPRIAVAGLNPHAGEGGILGDEDINEISPAIEEAKTRGINNRCKGNILARCTVIISSFIRAIFFS